MFDFRLKVFQAVATKLNFTRAARELYISQPAVTKHIKEIELFYKVSVFERNGTNIRLTDEGQLLLKYAETVLGLTRNLEFDMNAFSEIIGGELRIGASTTVSQYVIPVLLAEFQNKYRDLHINLSSDNTLKVEEALLNNKVDIGIIEGLPKNPSIKYSRLLKDEIVLVCKTNNSLIPKRTTQPDDLIKLPFVLRENGSGTLEVIDNELKKAGLSTGQIKNTIHFSSTESIKLFLLNSNYFSFISIHAVLKELNAGELTIVDVKGLEIERNFYLIQRQGQPNKIADNFMKFATGYSFKL